MTLVRQASDMGLVDSEPNTTGLGKESEQSLVSRDNNADGPMAPSKQRC